MRNLLFILVTVSFLGSAVFAQGAKPQPPAGNKNAKAGAVQQGPKASPQLQAARQKLRDTSDKLKSMCANDFKAAGCKVEEKVGSAVKCLGEFRKATPTHKIEDKCRELMTSMGEIKAEADKLEKAETEAAKAKAAGGKNAKPEPKKDKK